MESPTVADVQFKGIREGLLLTLSDRPAISYEAVLEQARAELEQKEDFLQGGRVVLDVGNRRLKRTELSTLQALLAEHGLELWAVLARQEETKSAARGLGLGTRLAGSNTDLEGNQLTPTGRTAGQGAEPEFPAAQDQGNALLLCETLRSGKSIFYEGHVVIIGDVNPGAEIVATGNVVVWGRLRGLVHAGATGDTSAMICALELVPTQLRIAEQIAIPPEERAYEPVPERVSIRDGQIMADPWRESKEIR